MQTAKIIALLVLVGLVAVFTFHNTAVVEVTIFFWTISMSVSLLLLGVLFLGILIGLCVAFFNKWRKEKKQPEKQPLRTYSGT